MMIFGSNVCWILNVSHLGRNLTHRNGALLNSAVSLWVTTLVYWCSYSWTKTRSLFGAECIASFWVYVSLTFNTLKNTPKLASFHQLNPHFAFRVDANISVKEMCFPGVFLADGRRPGEGGKFSWDFF